MRLVSESLNLGVLSGTGRAALGFSRTALIQSSITKALFSKRKNEGRDTMNLVPGGHAITHSIKWKLSCKVGEVKCTNAFESSKRNPRSWPAGLSEGKAHAW